MSFDLVIDNGIIVAPGAEPAPLAVGVRDGKIAAIGAHGTLTGGKDVVDAKGLHVFPGLVDPHIHVGFINKVDTDFESESASAATGGVCTVIPFYRHMAGDNPARAIDSGTVGTDNNYAESFPFIKAAGENHSHVDFSLHYAFTSEGHLNNLDSFLDLGVGSFKFYLAYKDDEATTYKFIGEGPNDGLLLDAMKAFGERGNVVACIHAENPEIYKRATKRVKESGRSDLRAWEESRPAICEAENVSRSYYFGEITGAPVYIVHMSLAGGAGRHAAGQALQQEGVRRDLPALPDPQRRLRTGRDAAGHSAGPHQGRQRGAVGRHRRWHHRHSRIRPHLPVPCD